MAGVKKQGSAAALSAPDLSEIAALTTAQVTSLTTAALVALSTADVANGLTTDQVGALCADIVEPVTAPSSDGSPPVEVVAPVKIDLLAELVAASRETMVQRDYTMHAEIEGMIDALQSLKMRLARSTMLPPTLVAHLQSLL